MKNLIFAVFSAILFAASFSVATHPVLATPYVNARVIAAFNRGYAYLRRCDYNRAIAEYTAVLALRPNSANALINQDLAHSRAGDYRRSSGAAGGEL